MIKICWLWFDTILTVVYRLGKYSHFIPFASPFIAKLVAAHFYEEIVWLHEIPCSILSYRDAISLGNFGKNYFVLVRFNFALAPLIILNIRAG